MYEKEPTGAFQHGSKENKLDNHHQGAGERADNQRLIRRGSGLIILACALFTVSIVNTRCSKPGVLNSPAGRLDDGQIMVFEGEPQEPVLEGDTSSPVVAKSRLEMDPKFCEALPYGECFTLLIQVPSASLQADPGLSMLNLALASAEYRKTLQRACDEGLNVSLPRLAFSGFAGHRIFSRIKKARCVFESLARDNTPLPALAQNEFGMKVRLVTFDVKDENSSISPAFGQVTFDRARIDLKFHDGALRGRTEWTPFRGGLRVWNFLNHSGVFGTAHTGIRFNSDLQFHFNPQGTMDYLDDVVGPLLESVSKGEGLGELGAEVIVVKQAVAAIAAGSNPVVPALILVAVAADAIRDMCQHESSDCRVISKDRSVREEMAALGASGEIAQSETKATFVDGLKHIPYAIIQGVFHQADIGHLEGTLNLASKPFWLGQ